MSEPLDLEPIKAREKAATPGPWRPVRDGVRCPDARMPGQSFRLFTLSSFEMAQADVAFVAAAREDVPALVAEVENLRAVIAGMQVCPDCGQCLACGRPYPDGWARAGPITAPMFVVHNCTNGMAC